MKLNKQISAVVLGLGLASPIYAMEIINNVSSSASTGGNSVSPGGEIIQGESKTSVKIYTEVDGEVVTNIDEEVTGPEAKIDLPAGQGQAGKNVEVNLSNATTTATTKESNPIIAFLNKIFNYVLSIFS